VPPGEEGYLLLKPGGPEWGWGPNMLHIFSRSALLGGAKILSPGLEPVLGCPGDDAANLT
jgi:hypothetical protein